MARKDIELKIGAFVTIGLVLLVVMLILFGQFRLFRETYKVSCYFKQSVGGVTPGVDVTMLGKRIGNATSIEIMPENKVKVALQVDKNYRIPMGSTIEKVQSSFLGDYYLAINLPAEEVDEFLPTDGTADLIGMVDNSLGELAPKVSRMLTEYEPRLGELMANLNSTILSLNAIVGDKESQRYLKDTLKYTSETMSKGPDIAGDIDGLVKSASDLVENINKATDTFNTQIGTLGKDYQGVAKDINAVAVKLDTILSSMQKISDKTTGDSTVGKLVSDQELYLKMIAALDEARSTLAQIKKTVKYLEENPTVVFWGDKKKAKPPESPAWWQRLFTKEEEAENQEDKGESVTEPKHTEKDPKKGPG